MGKESHWSPWLESFQDGRDSTESLQSAVLGSRTAAAASALLSQDGQSPLGPMLLILRIFTEAQPAARPRTKQPTQEKSFLGLAPTGESLDPEASAAFTFCNPAAVHVAAWWPQGTRTS